MATTGRVTNVTEHIAGSELLASVSAAASSIEVEDVEEFDLDGGQFTIGSETHTYIADEDTGILTLVGSTLASGYSEGKEVYLYPEVRERWCRIMEPDGEEELEARVPHTLYPLLPLGARTDDGTAEIVEADYVGTDLVVTDVVGREVTTVYAAEVIGDDPSSAQLLLRAREADPTPSWFSSVLLSGGASSARVVIQADAASGSASNTLLNDDGTSDWVLGSDFEWDTWTPTLTGWSSDPASGLYRYARAGNTVFVAIHQPANGTSNATTKTISLPFTAAGVVDMNWVGPFTAVDNGVTLTTPGRGIVVGDVATTISFFTNYASGAWTASGNARIAGFSLTYQAA